MTNWRDLLPALLVITLALASAEETAAAQDCELDGWIHATTDTVCPATVPAG